MTWQLRGRAAALLLYGALGAIPLISLNGCSSRLAEGAQLGLRASRHPGGYTIAVVDRTGSTETDGVRDAQWQELHDLADMAAIHKTKLTVWAMDHQSFPVWDSGIPDGSDSDAWVATVRREFGRRADNRSLSAANGRIARPGLLLRKVVSDIGGEKLPAGPLCLFFETDGAAEDRRDMKAFQREANAFCAGHPGLCVVVSGIRPEFREDWKTAFAPLGARYFASGPGEEDAAMRQYRAYVVGG